MKKTALCLLILALPGLSCSFVTKAVIPALESQAGVAPSAVPPAASPREDTQSILERLGGTPCPDDVFTCVTLAVPLDHFNPDGRTIDVVFGVVPASGERKGMFVTVTGGPGTAGLQSAYSYTSAFDPSVTENFDIVFFDQRGIGQSGGMQCVRAAANYYLADWDADTPSAEAALVQLARTFADDCTAESGRAGWLPYLGTQQAVEDLEAFREIMGDDRFWLYGESYGTEYAQRYAAAHPDRLAGLILDGAVDPTLSPADFLGGQAKGFNDVLGMTLAACNEAAECVESIGGRDAISAYSRLAEALKQAPIAFDFPLPSGGVARRNFTFADLEASAASYLYSETSRMIFLRALAAYSRNQDLAPMARILYDSLPLDPETLEPLTVLSSSDAVHYAVQCQDQEYFSGTPEQRAEAYLRAGDNLEASLPNFSALFYGDLPCVFWAPGDSESSRPAPLVADGIPTLVLGATADPATPISNGRSVFSNLADGYLVTQTGGPHVIFGRGVPCVDDLVTAFLVHDQVPDQRGTTCEGEVITAFVPLAPLDAGEFADPLEALSSLDDEFFFLPEYYFWDLTTPTVIGCPFGGSLSFEGSDAGETLAIEDCAFSEGFVMNGRGIYDYNAAFFSLAVAVTGLEEGALIYTRDADYVRTVQGTYAGEPVDLKQ
jgi:pimeloyl-ACP methyl ester carboxylesterase